MYSTGDMNGYAFTHDNMSANMDISSQNTHINPHIVILPSTSSTLNVQPSASLEAPKDVGTNLKHEFSMTSGTQSMQNAILMNETNSMSSMLPLTMLNDIQINHDMLHTQAAIPATYSATNHAQMHGLSSGMNTSLSMDMGMNMGMGMSMGVGAGLGMGMSTLVMSDSGILPTRSHLVMTGPGNTLVVPEDETRQHMSHNRHALNVSSMPLEMPMSSSIVVVQSSDVSNQSLIPLQTQTQFLPSPQSQPLSSSPSPPPPPPRRRGRPPKRSRNRNATNAAATSSRKNHQKIAAQQANQMQHEHHITSHATFIPDYAFSTPSQPPDQDYFSYPSNPEGNVGVSFTTTHVGMTIHNNTISTVHTVHTVLPSSSVSNLGMTDQLIAPSLNESYLSHSYLPSSADAPVLLNSNKSLSCNTGLTLGIPAPRQLQIPDVSSDIPSVKHSSASHLPSSPSASSHNVTLSPPGSYNVVHASSFNDEAQIKANTKSECSGKSSISQSKTTKSKQPQPTGSRYSTRLNSTRRQSADASQLGDAIADGEGSTVDFSRSTQTFEQLTFRTKRVKVACVPCRQQKMACDCDRPCARCRRHGREDRCIDFVPGMSPAAAQAAMLQAAAAAQAARQASKGSNTSLTHDLEAEKISSESSSEVKLVNNCCEDQREGMGDQLKDENELSHEACTHSKSLDEKIAKSDVKSSEHVPTTEHAPTESEPVVLRPQNSPTNSPNSKVNLCALSPVAIPPKCVTACNFPPSLSATVAECNRESLTQEQMSDLQHQERAKALGSPVDVAALGVNAGTDPLALMRAVVNSRLGLSGDLNYMQQATHPALATVQNVLLANANMTQAIPVVVDTSKAAQASELKPESQRSSVTASAFVTPPNVEVKQSDSPSRNTPSSVHVIQCASTSNDKIEQALVQIASVPIAIPLSRNAEQSGDALIASSSTEITSCSTDPSENINGSPSTDEWVGDTTALGTSDDISFSTRTFSSTPKPANTQVSSGVWASSSLIANQDSKLGELSLGEKRARSHDDMSSSCPDNKKHSPISACQTDTKETIAYAMSLYGRSAMDTSLSTQSKTKADISSGDIFKQSARVPDSNEVKRTRTLRSLPDLSGTIKVQHTSLGNEVGQMLVPSARGIEVVSNEGASDPQVLFSNSFTGEILSRVGEDTVPSQPCSASSERGEPSAPVSRSNEVHENRSSETSSIASRTWKALKSSPETPAECFGIHSPDRKSMEPVRRTSHQRQHAEVVGSSR